MPEIVWTQALAGERPDCILGKDRRHRVIWLSMACLGLFSLSPLYAQEPKLRDTLKGHSDWVYSVASSPDNRQRTCYLEGALPFREFCDV
jgi:hypothetical protein